MIRRLVIYPTLLAAFPIVSLYQHNALETYFEVLLIPLALVLLIVPTVWGLLALALRDPHRAGLITGLLLFYFYTIPHIFTGLDYTLEVLGKPFLLQELGIQSLETMTVETLAVVGLIVWIGLKWKERAKAWTFPLNVFGIILVALPLANAAIARFGGAREITPIREAIDVALDGKSQPDIYYIILDAFGRPDVLREIYDLDLEPFLSRLEERGFFVARRSTSNYPQTRLSLSSSLNGAYLDPLADKTAGNEDPLHDLIRDSGLTRALRRAGYTILSFDSGFHLTENLLADEILRPVPHLDEFHRQLIDMTALRFVYGGPTAFNPFRMSARRTLGILDALPGIAGRPEPTFTFAHILSPHPPFLFGPEGEIPSHPGAFSIADGDQYKGDQNGDYVARYHDQAGYLADKVADAIERILADSPEPPIIILQGDHGPGSRLVMGDPEKTDLHERFSILNAYHLPGFTPDHRPEGLDEAVSPVNSFRIVFRAYFGADLELLENRCYFATWDTPYDFLDITTKVRGDSAVPTQ